jgi:ubiquinone/menaquinone biosynthesis C-methylase UbiE
LSVDPVPAVIDAAQRLGVSAGIERTSFRVAPLHNLPMRAEQYTHAWSVEGLAALAEPVPALREALRVLRPAGLLSVVLRGRGAAAPEVAAWAETVAAAGFINIAIKTLAAPELPYAVYYAEHVLRTALASAFQGHERDRLLALAAALAVARSNRARRVLLFAERPS